MSCERFCRVIFAFDRDIDCIIKVDRGVHFDNETIIPENNSEYLLEQGVYSVFIDAEGYCSEERIVLIEEEDIGTEMSIKVELIALSGSRAEFKGCMYSLPESLEQKLYNNRDILGVDKFKFDTPGFGGSKGGTVFTNSEERMSFLKELSRRSNVLTLYQINDIPVINISHNDKKVKEKIKIMYQAQIHGTEPSAGEGALAVINEFAAGRMNHFLEHMEILIVPCVNTKGADCFERDSEAGNINRDALQLECEESRVIHELFYSFKPDVVIDAHSFTRANGIKGEVLDRGILDIRISPAYSLNINSDINILSKEITAQTLEAVSEYGLRTGYYGNSVDAATSRIFYGLHNIPVFLLESEGTRSGKQHFKRNVYGQYVSVKTLFEKILERYDEIKDIAYKKGKSFSRFVLQHEKSYTCFDVTEQESYDLAGNIVRHDNQVKFPQYDVVVASVTRPEAYYLHSKDIGVKYAVDLLRKHNVKIECLNGPVTIDVSRYIKQSEGINILDSQVETFEGIVYKISTKQVMSNIVCSLLEPGSKDSVNLLDKGIFKINKDNTINIYRK